MGRDSLRNKVFKRVLAEIHNKPYIRNDNRISSFDNKHFIAWDGEGIESDKPPLITVKNGKTTKVVYQKYGLLMNNEGVNVVDIKNGLSTIVCLNTLMNSTTDKQAIHVCFGASYDVNMMLRDIPRSKLIQLHKGYSIDYHVYNIEYRPRKSLSIREYYDINNRYIYDEKKQEWKKHYKRTMTLWDVFGFFQASFIEALKAFMIEDKERYVDIIAKIKEGKDRRGRFTIDEMYNFIIPYCKLEVDALCDLMNVLHKHFTFLGLVLSRWDGAGSIASAMMKKHHVKLALGRENTPQEVVNASEYGYFGGRIECLRYGNYKRKIYRKDINSAYPEECTLLPNLSNGIWEHHIGDIPLSKIKNHPHVSLYLISWKAKNQENILCPFPWRDKVGNVFFPPYGKSWVWRPEVLSAMKYMQKDFDFYIHECWTYTPYTNELPFQFVKDYYEYRKQLVKQGNGAEKMLKLGINSIYGKLAQSVGYHRSGEKPPFHNLIMAGMITSGTRAKLLEAAIQSPQDVIMLATDGIYSTKDIFVDVSYTKELGKWEASEYDYMTTVASGVYWYSEKQEETSYSRGFDKYTILRDEVIKSWEKGEKTLSCETTRFVGLGSAIGLHDFSVWRSWRTIERDLGLNMDSVAKRYVSSEHANPSEGLVQTYASTPKRLKMIEHSLTFPYSDSAMSTKSKFRWDDELPDIIDGISMREYLEEVAHSRA